MSLADEQVAGACPADGRELTAAPATPAGGFTAVCAPLLAEAFPSAAGPLGGFSRPTLKGDAAYGGPPMAAILRGVYERPIVADGGPPIGLRLGCSCEFLCVCRPGGEGAFDDADSCLAHCGGN